MPPTMQMQGNMMAGPIDPNFFGGMRYYYVTDPLMELANAEKATIKQKFELVEALTGCETKNEYYVFVKDKNGNEKYLFKAKEESNCCCRNFFPGSFRPFKLHVRKIEPNQGGKEKKIDYVELDRPCKCTFCCCNRPVMNGKFVANNEPFGKITQPCTICNPKIEVYNRSGLGAWTITCNCCQCGYLCSNSCCGRCSDVDFEIYQGTSSLKGKPPGTMKKKFKGMKSLIGDADFFSLVFPEQANAEERLLLVNAVIMLDFMHFEDKS